MWYDIDLCQFVLRLGHREALICHRLRGRLDLAMFGLSLAMVLKGCGEKLFSPFGPGGIGRTAAMQFACLSH